MGVQCWFNGGLNFCSMGVQSGLRLSQLARGRGGIKGFQRGSNGDQRAQRAFEGGSNYVSRDSKWFQEGVQISFIGVQTKISRGV